MTKVAILTDTHDHREALERALQAATDAGADLLLHLGDLCAPFMLNLMGERFSGPIHVVFGNNDGDGRLLQTIANKHPHITLHGIYAELTVNLAPGGASAAGSRTIAIIHYPEPARRIAQSGQLDLVCYGHDHTRLLEQIGRTWLVNPGDIMGLRNQPGWALYDADPHTVTIYDLA